MIRNELILDLNSELIVDNFAGGGGASTGIELALGRHADHAINHDAEALGMHRINHPQTVHHCEDIFHVNPTQITEGRRVDLGWFSPDCKHFSKAKGGKPLDKKIRGLAFVMFRWAAIRTRVMVMENVEEIQTWGPLLHHRKHKANCRCGKPCGKADPRHKGRTWNAFLQALGPGLDYDHPDMDDIIERLKDTETGVETITRDQLVRGFGYHTEHRELRGYAYGAPTIRKRLFLIARCDGLPIVWPKETHMPASEVKRGYRPWRTIAECIDWTLPCPSIFLTKRQAKAINCRRPLAKSTLKRIACGVGRYVINSKKPFLVSLTHQGGDRVEPVDEPARTLTGAHRGEKAVVDTKLSPFLTEHANASTQRNFPSDEPLRTQCAQVKGGHFSLVAPVLAREFGQSTGQSVDKPAPTVMPGGQGKTSLVATTLAHIAHGEKTKSGKKRGRGAVEMTEPTPTVTASKDLALVSAHLMVNTSGHPGCAMNKPGPTQATGGHEALVAAHLTKFTTGGVGQEVTKPIPTIAAGSHAPDTHGGAASVHGLVAANMVKLRGHIDTHNKPESAETPLHTASAGGNHHALSACYLAQHNAGGNTNPGHPADKPISTISQKGSQQQVVAASLAAYYGSEADGQAVDEPLRTATTKARFIAAMSEAVAPPLTEELLASALRVARFLRSHGVEFEGELATVGEFVIVDIGMRMLTPRELFRAQGFPESYVIDRAWLVNPKTGDIIEKKLSKEAQIRMCGNSVCPPVAEAIVRANVPELCVWQHGERQQFERKNKACLIAS